MLADLCIPGSNTTTPTSQVGVAREHEHHLEAVRTLQEDEKVAQVGVGGGLCGITVGVWVQPPRAAGSQGEWSPAALACFAPTYPSLQTLAAPHNRCSEGGSHLPYYSSPSHRYMHTCCIWQPQVVQVRKKKDHFIFTIESTGILPPELLFEQALGILHEKAVRLAGRL